MMVAVFGRDADLRRRTTQSGSREYTPGKSWVPNG